MWPGLANMIDIVIAHAAWAPGRRESLDRLRQSLGPDGERVLVVSSAQKQHANEWAVNVWRSIRDIEEKNPSVEASLVLNDDVTCHPEIMRGCATLTAALPGHLLSLHGNFPRMRDARAKGATACRCYWPSGPAMVLPRGLAGELLDWLETVPPAWFSGNINEDGVVASFLWSRQTPSVVTIPALVRHDTNVRSTLPGYDSHPNRRSHVDWVDGAPLPDWSKASVDDAPYVGIPWMTDGALRQLGATLKGQVEGPACIFCEREPGKFVSDRTGRAIGAACAMAIAQGVAGEKAAGRL
jgi:hypothetical protein